MRTNQLTREYVRQLLTEHEDRGEVVAILLDEFPYLEKVNRLHSVTGIEAILSDLGSYE